MMYLCKLVCLAGLFKNTYRLVVRVADVVVVVGEGGGSMKFVKLGSTV